MAVTQSSPPTFSEGKRNEAAGRRVEIAIADSQDSVRILATIASGGSETSYSGRIISPTWAQVFIVTSRRSFAPYFGKSVFERGPYVSHVQKLSGTREEQRQIPARIFHINSDPDRRARFQEVLGQIIDPPPDWTIEQTDHGDYYFKYSRGALTHSSEGLGEGLLNILIIVDALYDSEPGSMIVIDEPELSLHPQLQGQLRRVFVRYAADRQIVVATHAPKFIDWPSIAAGAQIVRTRSDESGISIHEL
jgi:hypothetical protein